MKNLNKTSRKFRFVLAILSIIIYDYIQEERIKKLKEIIGAENKKLNVIKSLEI